MGNYRIKSITDVITNSSTEVFAMTSRESVMDLKRMIDLLLKVSGSPKTCDDLFDIRLEVPSLMDPWEDYEEDKPWDDLTEEEKIDWCLEMADYDSTRFYPEVRVIPKSPDIPKDLINLLEASAVLGLSPVDATFG